jgi:hypothetical protein
VDPRDNLLSARSPHCAACRVATVVRLEYISVGDAAPRLAWHCLRCHAHWLAVVEPWPARGGAASGSFAEDEA